MISDQEIRSQPSPEGEDLDQNGCYLLDSMRADGFRPVRDLT